MGRIIEHGRHGGYTWDELNAALERVRNPENWKMPINALIPGTATEREREAIDLAVSFFCGCLPEIFPDDGHGTNPGWGWKHAENEADRHPPYWRVQASGYYACIGA